MVGGQGARQQVWKQRQDKMVVNEMESKGHEQQLKGIEENTVDIQKDKNVMASDPPMDEELVWAKGVFIGETTLWMRKDQLENVLKVNGHGGFKVAKLAEKSWVI